MNITIQQPSAEMGLYGANEIWVTVHCNVPPPDWITVRDHLTTEYPDMEFPKLPFRYIPSYIEPDERETFGFNYEEFWILKKVTT